MAATETSNTLLHKVIIPVVTTVLGATAIYFLGFNKKNSGRTDMEQLLISKEATVKAWKSFVVSQNIGYKNMKSISDEFTEKITRMNGTNPDPEKVVAAWTDYKDDLFRETRKANQDIEAILKENDIDRDFISFLNRALENGKNDEKKSSLFFDNIASLIRSDLSPEAKGAKFQTEVADFTTSQQKLVERSATEAEGIGKILADRYSQAFDLNELLVYVDYKKEKDKKDAGGGITKDENTNKPADGGRQAPVDPNAGTENKDNPQKNVNPPNDGSHANNQAEPTESILAGQWETTDGNSNLELSRSGDMYWTFVGKGYTYGDWKLMDGKIRMNATNPDTKRTSLIIGSISDFTRNSFTLTFMTSPKEIYHFRKKADY